MRLAGYQVILRPPCARSVPLLMATNDRGLVDVGGALRRRTWATDLMGY